MIYIYTCILDNKQANVATQTVVSANQPTGV